MIVPLRPTDIDRILLRAARAHPTGALGLDLLAARRTFLCAAGPTAYLGLPESNPRLLLCARRNDWDSKFFGLPMGEVRIMELRRGGSHRAREMSALLDSLGRSDWPGRHRYLLARLDSPVASARRVFESHGYHPLISSITLTLARPPKASDPISQRTLIEDQAPRDLPQITALALRAFPQSRFHAEPRLGNARSNDLHAEWIRNCCVGGLADKVLVARRNGRIVGFHAVRMEDAQVTRALGRRWGKIVLIAVAPELRGAGIGAALCLEGLRWLARRGADRFHVRTHFYKGDARPLRFYEKLGFTRAETSLYLSRWAGSSS